MSDRIVIISDTHLGRPGGTAGSGEALRPIWEGASRLIVNGDVAEVHHPVYRVGAAKAVIALSELCEADGVELTLISGNHDPFVSDLRHLMLANNEVFVMHGDLLHPSIVPWSPSVTKIRKAFNYALACLADEERSQLEMRLSAAQYAAHVEWAEWDGGIISGIGHLLLRPWMVWTVWRYWKSLPGLAVDFMRQYAPESKYVLIGHSHHKGIWEVEDKVIINTGCYGFPSGPRAVVIEGNVLSVHEIKRLGKCWELRGEAVGRYELGASEVKQPAGMGVGVFGSVSS